MKTMHECYAEFEAAAAIERSKLAEAKKIRDDAIRAANDAFTKAKAECDEKCKAEYAKFRKLQDEFRAGRAAARDAREKAAAEKLAAKTAAATAETPTTPVAETTVEAPVEATEKKTRTKKNA